MTEAKKKAEYLIKQFYNIDKCENHESEYLDGNVCKHIAKQCAILCVNEILEVRPSYKYWETYSDEQHSAITFWTEVLTELNNMP